MDALNADHMTGIARAVTVVGSENFPKVLAALCLSVFNYDSIFVSVFSRDCPPRQLYSNLDPEATRRTIGPYLSYAYLLDPFYGLFKADVGTTVVSLDDCAPDDFRVSDYYRTFYSEIGLRNEVTIFVDAGAGSSIVLSLGQRGEDQGVAADAKALLEGILPVIAALCLRHWPDLSPGAGADPADAGVRLAFERFHSCKLSTREAEIVRLMLKGHSTKSIARLLGNSPETVKVHRKRIYAKLKISSQGELFSMFLSALAAPHPEVDAAPEPAATAKVLPAPDKPRLLN